MSIIKGEVTVSEFFKAAAAEMIRENSDVCTLTVTIPGIDEPCTFYLSTFHPYGDEDSE